MKTAKIFQNGRSQAVRLPKEFRFKDDEVAISSIGDIVILVPKDKIWDTFLEGINKIDNDCFDEMFQEDREALTQERKDFL